MGRPFGLNPQEVFYPLHMLYFACSMMNELEVTRTIHQSNSKHHTKIEVLLENKDDVHHLQVSVSNACLREPPQLGTVTQAVLFHMPSVCSTFSAASGVPSHGWGINGNSVM